MAKRSKGEEGEGEVGVDPLSPYNLSHSSPLSSARGLTLIELVIVITVLSVLTIGVIPIVRTSIRRQKEQQLRETLRMMRGAIDAFKRDTVGMQCGPSGQAAIVPPVNQNPGQPGQPGVYLDPRSHVVIADCKIFNVDNIDRYPPDLETLVDGVDVVSRQASAANQFGSVSTENGGATANSGGLIPKKKIYLREIPIDPITGEKDWCLMSSLESADNGCSANPPNVFDVRSKARGEALNGEKYSDW
ncbi:MAG TPA: type II secretion system protein [Pyrinomonadaceae bacterium]|nr:type II secretion system protein [Pyrinomonadaceae bacterium]